MKTKYWLALIFLLLLFLYFIPRSIMYSDDELMGWFIYGLIFGVLPYLIYNFIDSHFTTNWTLGYAALSVLIVGPTFGLFQEYRETKELRKNGAWSIAIVSDRKFIDTENTKCWAIQCFYKTQDKIYSTKYQNDPKNKYKLGDTLKINYSRDYPKIYNLADEKNRSSYFSVV